MILSDKVKIRIGSSNFKHFKSLGFDIKKNDIIEVNVIDLLRYSEVIVDVKCDYCSEELSITYSSYNQYLDKNDESQYYCNKCKGIRTKQSNLQKYGVENVSQLKTVKEKKKKTNLKNWGTENVFQSNEIKIISKKTKNDKYGDVNFTNREKSKKTCLKNNGVEWPTQSSEILEKRNFNNIKKWGVKHYTQTSEYKIKSAKKCLEKYGNEHYLATEECQIKSRETCQKKYGVDYPSQNPIIHKKQFPKIKTHESGLPYQGTFEKDFLDLCQNIGINLNRAKSIKYIIENKQKIYYPDYYYPDLNLIIEIKSDYIYKLHEELNLIKQKACIDLGFNFLFIIDKNYDDFLNLLK